jgi:hypothetical protein
MLAQRNTFHPRCCDSRVEIIAPVTVHGPFHGLEEYLGNRSPFVVPSASPLIVAECDQQCRHFFAPIEQIPVHALPRADRRSLGQMRLCLLDPTVGGQAGHEEPGCLQHGSATSRAGAGLPPLPRPGNGAGRVLRGPLREQGPDRGVVLDLRGDLTDPVRRRRTGFAERFHLLAGLIVHTFVRVVVLAYRTRTSDHRATTRHALPADRLGLRVRWLSGHQ